MTQAEALHDLHLHRRHVAVYLVGTERGADNRMVLDMRALLSYQPG